MNDGTKAYDVGKDGHGQEIGSCSVRSSPWVEGAGELTKVLQLDFRRTDVTAKARITYFKGKFLEVSSSKKA